MVTPVAQAQPAQAQLRTARPVEVRKHRIRFHRRFGKCATYAADCAATRSSRGEICRYNEGRRCYEIVELRNVAVKVRKQDGGTLTPEHLADLQTKLDALLARTQ